MGGHDVGCSLLKSATSHHNARLLSLIESLSNKYMTADPDSFGRMLQFSGKLKARFAA